MKKIFAVILAFAMLLPMVLSVGTVAGAEEYTVKPFYGAGWSDINRLKFPNLEGLTIIGLKDNKDGTLSLSYGGKTDPKEMAEAVKKIMDRNPEGMRHLFLAGTYDAFYVAPEDAVFMENGIGQMKKLFTAFLKEYHAIGGKLESLVLDTEYVNMGSWYIYSKFYGGLYEPTPEAIKENNFNRNVYNDIVANPKYATEIRPLLVERGFKFYENVGGNKSEIWSMFPNSYLNANEKAKYTGCESIWNAVMGIHLANYLNEALYEPLMEYYPGAIMSDYQEPDSYAWLKNLSDTGDKGYVGGNSIKVGNASNYNTYSSRPGDLFYKDSKGNYLYKNPAAYNKVEYEDDPYNMFLWDINKFKNIYAATENKKMTAWIAEYDYGERAGSVANTAYYTETLYHIGMLNPQPFLLYIYDHNDRFLNPNGSVNTTEYNKRIQVVSEILYELTRVAGYSDRTPIETPANWNDGFVLSGMYTGGRNLWRLTPDTTDGTTLEAFKIKDNAPTFKINGSTITFPQGKIIADNSISVVGSAGYWIETPKNVQPVIIRDADRYSKNPSYEENFDSYADGTAFTSDIVAKPQTWNVTKTNDLLIRNGALALTGTATLNNVKLPKNITAGDSYAKQQAWEVSFTLPTDMNSGSYVKLLTTSGDGGIKLEGGKVYVDNNGSYQELDGVTLRAGQKYTVKRELNFIASGAHTNSYSIYNASGALLKQVANIPMKSNAVVPVQTISISCASLTTNVLIDDYKLYPTGLAKDLEVYNAKNGIRLDATAKNDAASVAYRFSWMNATNAGRKIYVKAAYYSSNGALIADDLIKTVEMAPGADNVESGIIQNNAGGKVVIYLEDAGAYTPRPLPTDPPATQPTNPPITQPTTQPGTQPTEGTVPTQNPTDPSSGDPVTEPSDLPSTAPTTTGTEATTPSGTDAATKPDDDTDGSGEKKGIGGGMIALIVIGAVLVLGAAGAGVYYFVFYKKKMTPPVEPTETTSTEE